MQCEYDNFFGCRDRKFGATDPKRAVTARAILHVITFPREASARNPASGALFTGARAHNRRPRPPNVWNQGHPA